MSDYTKAKGYLKAINDLKLKGIKKVKYVGLKKDKMLETFMDLVEAVDDKGLLDKLPEDMVQFYEDNVEDEEEVESDEVEDVEDDEVEDDEDDYEDVEDEEEIEDDEIEEDEEEEVEEVEEDEEEEEEPEPAPKKKKGKKGKPAKKAKPTKPAKKAKPTKKKKAAEEAPKKPRTIRATTRMSARIADGVLTLQYGDNKPRKLKVQNENKPKLKATIAKAVEIAKEYGATPGQIQAVKKAFTSNGYHVLR